VGGKRVIERQGKCKKKFKFLSVTYHCEPLFSNQTSRLYLLDLQSFSKKCHCAKFLWGEWLNARQLLFEGQRCLSSTSLRLVGKTILSRDNKVFVGWVDTPANINEESSLPKSSYTRVATIEPSLVVIQCMYDLWLMSDHTWKSAKYRSEFNIAIVIERVNGLGGRGK
jgi:hypothetical protein